MQLKKRAIDAVVRLLELDVSYRDADDNGETPLEIAMRLGFSDVATILMGKMVKNHDSAFIGECITKARNKLGETDVISEVSAAYKVAISNVVHEHYRRNPRPLHAYVAAQKMRDGSLSEGDESKTHQPLSKSEAKRLTLVSLKRT